MRDRNLPLEVEFEFTHDLKAMMIKIMKRNSFSFATVVENTF